MSLSSTAGEATTEETQPSPPQPPKEAGMGPSKRLLLVLFSLTALAFLAGTIVMRAHLLDDTFIHLRYVENLYRDGELAYNPGEPSFGTSALTFVLLLGKVAAWLPREALPSFAKGFSVACHAAALGLLVWRARGLYRERNTPAALLLSVFALTVALLPSGRWLQDGMETSLALLLSIAAPLVAISFVRSPSKGIGLGVLTGLVAVAPGCLRIDLLPISLAALGLAFGPSLRDRRAFPVAFAWLAAWLSTMALLYVQTGHIVSDSAVAKQAGHIEPRFVLSFLYSMMTVSPVWLFGAAGLLWSVRRPNLMATLGLLPILAVLSAGTAVGQFIHGARYFLPALGFAWVVFAELPTWKELKREGRGLRAIGYAMAGASLFHMAILAGPVVRLTRPVELRLEALSAMDETTLLAANDIGRLGWSTKARILDIAGLVNGRELAQPGLDDGRKCHAIEALGIPKMLVLTESQSEPVAQGDVINLRCPGFELRYRKLGEPVMKAWNVATPLVWFAWERAHEGEGRNVQRQGGLR